MELPSILVKMEYMHMTTFLNLDLLLNCNHTPTISLRPQADREQNDLL